MRSNRRPPLIVRRRATAIVSPANAANDRWRQSDSAAGSVKSQMRAASPLTSSPTRPANTSTASSRSRRRNRRRRASVCAPADRCQARAGRPGPVGADARSTSAGIGPSFSRSTIDGRGRGEIGGAPSRACRPRTRARRRRHPPGGAATPPARARRDVRCAGGRLVEQKAVRRGVAGALAPADQADLVGRGRRRRRGSGTRIPGWPGARPGCRARSRTTGSSSPTAARRASPRQQRAAHEDIGVAEGAQPRDRRRRRAGAAAGERRRRAHQLRSSASTTRPAGAASASPPSRAR